MREIPLTRGQVALVDDEDYEMLVVFKWHAHTQWNRNYESYYARHKSSKGSFMMHSFLTGWRRTDHIDHNGLNNQRSNLREVTNGQNIQNSVSRIGSSQFKGVSWWKSNQRWIARIHLNGENFYLGGYVNEVDAALAYDRAARKKFGEFALLNFPEQEG